MKNNSKPKAPVGASLIILSSIFYASYGVWTKLMGNFFDGYMASALRSILVLMILLPITYRLHDWQPLKLKQNWRYIAGMIIASLFTWGPLYYAFLHAGVGISLAINYASIVIGTFFFGWLFAGEQFTRDKALSAILGIAGLTIIFSPSLGSIGWIALIAAVISGVSAGANNVFAKQIKYNATQTTVVLWSTSVIGNIIMARALSESYPQFGWHVQWLYLVFFALASVIASWSFVKGIKLIEAGAAGILGLLEIVFGVLFGAVFFHERPGYIVLIGVLVVITAAAIPYVKNMQGAKGKQISEVS